MKGTWLLPTLNRPQLLKEFLEAYVKTKSSTPVLILVDETDPQKEAYVHMDYPRMCQLRITKGITMGDKVREVFEEVKKYDWVGILNDDHVPITEEWDKKVVGQINGHNVVSTNDGKETSKPWNMGKRLCGAICFSGKILRTLGYMFPANLHHLYSDDVWGFLFGSTQSAQILPDVCVWHNHAYFDESKKDDTFQKINGEANIQSPEPVGGMWASDRAAFLEWEKQAQADAQKIRDLQPRTGLMIATPCHNGTVEFEYASGLADTTLALGINNIYFELARVIGSSLIPHARNSLVDIFLKSKCQRLLFVDSDQGFSREHVFKLLQSPRRIIAGVTPHKRYPINLNFEPMKEDEHYFKELHNKNEIEFFKMAKEKADAKGDIEVARVGTGFVMIDRSVFEIMQEHVHEYLPFDNDQNVSHREWFKMGVTEPKGRYRGEDWFFMELAKKLKIPIFINANVILTHHGKHTFQVNEAFR